MNTRKPAPVRKAVALSDLAAIKKQLADAAAKQAEEAARAAAQAKLLATRMADRQLPALAQAMGAEGLREHHPFARHLMGARVAGFVDGSTEMLLERICAALPG